MFNTYMCMIGILVAVRNLKLGGLAGKWTERAVTCTVDTPCVGAAVERLQTFRGTAVCNMMSFLRNIGANLTNYIALQPKDCNFNTYR